MRMDVLVFSTGTKILKTHIYTWKNLENVLRNASSKVENARHTADSDELVEKFKRT